MLQTLGTTFEISFSGNNIREWVLGVQVELLVSILAVQVLFLTI